jgi:outer membrane protein OmpA-like peptidoglycan-associated protein
MNIRHPLTRSGSPLVAVAVASALLAACASTPMKPAGSAEVRGKLTQLQGDPALASRAPIAIKEAETAVQIAEQPQRDHDLAGHRVYIADRKVDTARAQAETRYAEDQRPALSAQRDSARLDARTREADVARDQASAARADSFEQKLAADRARGDASVARDQADVARDQATIARDQTAVARDQTAIAQADSADQRMLADRARGDADAAQRAASASDAQSRNLQQELDTLQAKVTERGWVVTLGDVLFTTGQADLRSGATGHLDKLVVFLNRYPDRTVAIEGHTDSVGSEDRNQMLSQRRADAVRRYLAAQGVGDTRLSSAGKGEIDPIAENDSSTGRQMNRRVELIISNPPVASR